MTYRIQDDDADRHGERRALERRAREFPEFTRNRLPCEKTAVLLRHLAPSSSTRALPEQG